MFCTQGHWVKVQKHWLLILMELHILHLELRFLELSWPFVGIAKKSQIARPLRLKYSERCEASTDDNR